MKIKKVLFYALAAVLGGCIPVISLNSFYNKSQILFDKNLLGTWIDEPNNPKTTWVFSQNDDPNISYNLEFTDEEGRKGSSIHVILKTRIKYNIFIIHISRYPLMQ